MAIWLAVANHIAILHQFVFPNYSKGKNESEKQPKS